MMSKSWSTSRKRAALYRQAGALAEFCLQLFPLLVAHSDDYGRLDADPETVKLVCDPGSPRPVDEFDAALGWFERVGLIQRYQAEGAAWLQVIKFDDHQPGMLSKRTAPKSPAPPTLPELPGVSLLTKPNLTEPNSREPKKNVSVETSSPPQPALLSFPVVGPGSGSWPLTADKVAEWAALFPGLDVLAESRKALAWVLERPRKRKTMTGMGPFLVAWFTRTVNRGGVGPAPEAAPQRAPLTCPHTPQCPAPGRWACSQKTSSEAYKASQRAAS